MHKSRLLLAILFLTGFSVRAQFFYAIGAAAGISYGKEGWSHEQWETQEKYLLGFNGALLAEFFSDPNFQWRSEIMYNQLGTKELVNANGYTNRTNFISFNNYLKVNYPLFDFIPYILIGPRVDYLFSRGAAVFPDAIGGMYSFHVSAAAGIGAEKICFGRWKPFIELFYHRDIMPSFIGSVASIDPNLSLKGTSLSEIINGHNFELRIGVKYVFDRKPECPHVDNRGQYINGIQ